jgi:hypothetical protein
MSDAVKCIFKVLLLFSFGTDRCKYPLSFVVLPKTLKAQINKTAIFLGGGYFEGIEW